MSKIEQYMKVKRFIERHEDLRWCNSGFDLRTFTKGIPSSEPSVDEQLLKVIGDAFSASAEYSGSEISYCASYYMGNALKTMVLKYMRDKLKQLAIEAKDEADNVLNTIQSQGKETN